MDVGRAAAPCGDLLLVRPMRPVCSVNEGFGFRYDLALHALARTHACIVKRWCCLWFRASFLIFAICGLL